MIPGLPTPLSLCLDAGDADDTFYSQRVYDLFPQMATANSGWNTNTGETSSVFGSYVATDGANDSDYIEWTAFLPAGNYKFAAIRTISSTSGKADLTIDGGAVVDTMDNYKSGVAGRNEIFLSQEFTLTEGSHAIRLTKNGKNASASSYVLNLQHARLIKQDATSALVSVANVPHVIDVPVVFADSHTNWNTLGMSTSYMFGTYMVSSGAQNDAVTFSFWAPKGNFTLAILHYRFTNRGIATVTVDGTGIGTIDQYGTPAFNVLDTSLTGTLAYTGTHTITFTMATKNASSSSHYGQLNHIQIRMTSITEPLSQDLAPEIALLWPAFNEDIGQFALTVNSATAYYYYYGNTSTLDDEITLTSNCVLRPGTYRLDVIGTRATNAGQLCLIDSGTNRGNADFYGSSLGNHVASGSGITLSGWTPHTFKLKSASKNASSSGYFNRFILARLVRTGA